MFFLILIFIYLFICKRTPFPFLTSEAAMQISRAKWKRRRKPPLVFVWPFNGAIFFRKTPISGMELES